MDTTRDAAVPPDADLFPFNPFLPEAREDPYPAYRRLREVAPVHRSPLGAWILTRYADVVGVLRDPRMSVDSRNSELFERFRASMPEYDPAVEGAPPMLFVDPPDHTRLRTLVNKAFTPRAVEAVRPRIEGIVSGLLDEVAGAGRMDVVADLAYPLPVRVICEMLGVPHEDRATFQGWSRELVHLIDPLVAGDTLARALEARLSFRDYFRSLFAERRARPRDDLLTALIAAEEAGDRLSEAELLSTCVLLLVAGHETTVNLIGNGTLALLRNPGELRRLRDDPSLARSAVEEFLRYDSPVQLTGRIPLDEVEIGGVPIRRGEQMVCVLGAANRDPEQFPDPDRLDVGRADNRHLAFSAGTHFCLGAPLARLEAQVAFEALVRRMPGLEVAGAPVWKDTVTLRGLSALPVSF